MKKDGRGKKEEKERNLKNRKTDRYQVKKVNTV